MNVASSSSNSSVSAPRRFSRRVGAAAALALIAGAVLAGSWLSRTAPVANAASPSTMNAPAIASTFDVRYKTVNVDGLEVFYREAGPMDAPVILLLHGFPTSSHMFRNLIPALAGEYRVIAPDYPGFGNSSMPRVDEFDYSFDNLASIVDKFTVAVGAEKFAVYVQDYGAPIGYRIASAHPERITGIIVQNGNAYEEGLRDFWVPLKALWKDPSPKNYDSLRPFLELAATKWQWTVGVKNASTVSPDTWTIDQAGMDRQGNKDIQLALFMSYGTNPPLYPKWQEYFRTHQPPTLIVWGKNDPIFPAEGAEPYKRDLKNLDFNLLDTGHFALEEKGAEIAGKILTFMRERVVK